MAFINILDIIYPVGSFYISNNNISPASIIGGTWTKISNAVLRGADSTGYIGSDTHTLTEEEMPKHTHNAHACGVGRGSLSQTIADGYALLRSVDLSDLYSSGPEYRQIEKTGNSQPHSIIQRSYNCHIWYRVS